MGTLIHECQIHTVIHIRSYVTPKFCVESHCNTHDISWSALTDDKELALSLAFNFPLVYGGLLAGANAIYPDLRNECLLGKNSRRKMIRRTKTRNASTCGDCDGCGWVEGGKYLQTVCKKCNGTGWERKPSRKNGSTKSTSVKSLK